MGIFSKINFGLSKTRNKMNGAIDDMLDSFDSFEEDLYMELEEILVMGDVGVTTAVQVVEELKARVKSVRNKAALSSKQFEQAIMRKGQSTWDESLKNTEPSSLTTIRCKSCCRQPLTRHLRKRASKVNRSTRMWPTWSRMP